MILYLTRLTRIQTELHETASLSIQEVAYTGKTKQNQFALSKENCRQRQRPTVRALAFNHIELSFVAMTKPPRKARGLLISH